jgi:hypothetical protein
LGGFDGNGGGFFLLSRPTFFDFSSELVSKSGCKFFLLEMLLINSLLSLPSELDDARFFLGRIGGGTGGRLALLRPERVLPLRLPRNEDFVDNIAFVAAELLAMLMQLMPLRFFGFLRLLLC